MRKSLENGDSTHFVNKVILALMFTQFLCFICMEFYFKNFDDTKRILYFILLALLFFVFVLIKTYQSGFDSGYRKGNLSEYRRSVRDSHKDVDLRIRK